MVPSLLARLQAADVVADPFPHLIVRDPLDAATCDRLVAEFPPNDLLAEGRPLGSNLRFSYPAMKALADPRLSPLWRTFVRSHVSQEFLDGLWRLFDSHVVRLYPHLSGPGRPTRAGVRNADSFESADVLLDAQVCVNTPVTGAANSVRTAHVDEPHKLFAGLFYLRHPEDDSRGGDLELYRLTGRSFAFYRGPYMDARSVERVATVRYERNVLILFVNSLQSLHGVTVRQPTPWTRCFLNLLGELEAPLFDLAPHQESSLGRLRRRLARLRS